MFFRFYLEKHTFIYRLKIIILLSIQIEHASNNTTTRLCLSIILVSPYYASGLSLNMKSDNSNRFFFLFFTIAQPFVVMHHRLNNRRERRRRKKKERLSLIYTEIKEKKVSLLLKETKWLTSTTRTSAYNSGVKEKQSQIKAR